MYNSDNPFGYEPPSSAKLLRSTLVAAVTAAVILVTVVLPAEYGIDPIGIGGPLGLKRMGEIKVQLAGEAAADEAATARAETERVEAEGHGTEPVEAEPTGAGSPAAAADAWRDEATVVLAPDEAVELKLVMKAGSVAEYSWTADGGTLNFNAHGDGGRQSIEYEKGRGAPGGDGALTAAFDGHHGWFWRNRSGNAVTLTLRTRGDYSELKRTM
jgi:hypothetical protein